MTPQTALLLNEIKALGVTLTINGKDLRLSGPRGAITEALAQQSVDNQFANSSKNTVVERR